MIVLLAEDFCHRRIHEWHDQGDDREPGEERMKTLLETVAVIHVCTKFVIF